jgi:hypothetical protein
MDFMLAYPQAEIEVPLFKSIPSGFKCEGFSKGGLVLTLKRNLYGQKQASQIWYQHLANLLITRHGSVNLWLINVSSSGQASCPWFMSATPSVSSKINGIKISSPLSCARPFDLTIGQTIINFLGVPFKLRSLIFLIQYFGTSA